MKKNKINKVLSTSIASSLLVGTVGSNIAVVNANATEGVIENISLEDGHSKENNRSTFDELNDEISLPQGFSSDKIGDITQSAFASFDENGKVFNIKGTGTYIGKDVNTKDNYHFVSYEVKGDATIIAKISEFDMSNAIYGQAGIFMRADNMEDNCDYFGVYIEPSKDEYRYAYRGNSNSGAATIQGLKSTSEGKYIKLVKAGNSFKYYISDDLNFDKDGVLSNGQTINNTDDTWHVGFVVSNGVNNTGEAKASFDEVMIKDETGVLFSTLQVEDNDDSEGSDDSNEDKTQVSKVNITQKPQDTVNNNNVEFAGNVVEQGKVKLMLNGSLVEEKELNAGETFKFDLSLLKGRNSVEAIFMGEDNVEIVKRYSILCLNVETYNTIVDANYSGQSGAEENGVKIFKTITEAVNSISTKNTERKVIFVKNGTYKEKLTIQSPYISIIGEDKENTIITYDDANGTINPETGVKYGTSKSASVYVKSKAFGFTAENLTIENSFMEKGNENEQAVALNNEADQSSFINCKFVGNQDTLLANASSSKAARQYYYKCSIEGDVDFIFGRAQAVFNDCDIISLDRNSKYNNGFITAANTWDRDAKGYLVINSRLLGQEGIAENSVSLGRPWRPSSATEKITPAVTYVNCYMGSHITAKGWEDMSADSLAADSRFFEYGSYGPGAKTSSTRNVLTEDQLQNYSIESVFSKESAMINGESAFINSWNPSNKGDDSTNVSIETIYGTTEIEEPETPAVPETPEVPEVPEAPVVPETPEDEIILTSKNWVRNWNGTWSLLHEGVRLTGWQKVDGEMYYLNDIGIMQKGWILLEGSWYHLESNGSMSTGWITSGFDKYYLHEDGKMATGWTVIDGKRYFFKNDGDMEKGWIKQNDIYYYLKSDGSMATGWNTIGFRKYYFYGDGCMATGWLKLDDNTYYMKDDGSMATGWIKFDNKWYHFKNDGTMTTGWVKDGLYWYFLYQDGSMACNTTVDGYKIGSTGKLIKR